MEELKYSLMHKDIPVCAITVDAISGSILRVSRPLVPELLPLGGNIDSDTLRKWWQRRAVPVSQGNIVKILEKAGLSTTQNYLVKNLGLSLSDHYWIKPLDMELGWKAVNLFANEFRDPVGDMQMNDGIGEMVDLPAYAFSPSSSLQGDLKKKWIISDGKRYLIKGNHGSNSQESLNEVVATVLHKKQAKHAYVSYSTVPLEQEPHVGCICECFTSDQLEFIPAYDIVESKKKPNDLSMYEHFIAVCADHGLGESTTRPFLEYQILTDYIITNIDRHLRNFGILRDTDTLQFVAMAPIFDSGNSMFWKTPKLPLCSDLADIEVNSFRSKESQLLEYARGVNLVDASSLPSAEEIRSIYAQDPLIPDVDAILIGYQKKIDMLMHKHLL